MDIGKINKIEGIALIFIVMINQVILGAPKIILTNSSSGATINILVISVVAILLVLGINVLFRPFQNSDIVDVSESLAGKPLKIIISIAYILLFFLSSVTCLYCIAASLKIIYFQSTDITYLALLFIVCMVVATRKGLNSLSKVNLVIIILSIGSMLVLFLNSISLFIPERAFPLLGTGADKVLFANLSNLFAFQGIAYILFLQPLLKNKEDFDKINIISTVLVSIYLLFSVLCLLLIFPFVSVTQDLLSMYLLTRIIGYGTFIARVDAIYLFFWVFAIMSYLSINLFFILRIFGKSTNIKDPSAISYGICAILLGTILFIKRIPTYYFLQNIILNNYFLVLLAISIVILILARFKYNFKHNKDRKNR